MRGVTPVANAAADAVRGAAGPAAGAGPEAGEAARPAGKRRGRPVAEDAAGSALDGNVLIIGFGRFGQIAGQVLLARGLRITIIEHDTDMIRSAANFGFHAYYGDGTRMDVLHAGGAAHACAILVCTDRKETTSRIVELARHAFPLVPILARAYDRQHAIALLQAGAAVEMRETFESALAFGAATLRELGTPEDAIEALARDIRQRDAERLQLQLAAGGDITRGRHLMHGNRWVPTPLTRPAREGRALNVEAAEAIREGGEPATAPALRK
jgi:glutathione-regulated potassium-efflux system protein KefB